MLPTPMKVAWFEIKLKSLTLFAFFFFFSFEMSSAARLALAKKPTKKEKLIKTRQKNLPKDSTFFGPKNLTQENDSKLKKKKNNRTCLETFNHL